MIMACTPLRLSSTAYKPGGVLTALGDCAHRVVATDADPFGRWCSMTITGKNQQLMRIYSIYQCVDQSSMSGIVGAQTYIAQQWELLKASGITQPQPRRQQLIQDLQKELQAIRNNTHLVLLGDFNKTIGRDPTLMATICSRQNLVDAVSYTHPSAYSICCTSTLGAANLAVAASTTSSSLMNSNSYQRLEESKT
eukprot:scaffold3153_cov92-Cylindrotheca_fusiformis.AAC.2